MKLFCIYALLDPQKDDTIFYIGKGSWLLKKGFNNRYYAHMEFAHNGKKGPLYAKIRKIERCGLEVGFTILSQWEQEIDALAEEKRMIAEIGLENLTNLMDGGVGSSHSEKTKRRLSEINKGKKLSEETKRKMSLAKTGTKLSEETRKKISEKGKGRKLSPETIEKIRHALLGKKYTLRCKPSEETIQKLIKRMKGKPSPMQGKHHSEETKKKMSEFHKLLWQNKTLEERQLSDEVKERMALAQQRRRLTESRDKFLVVLQQIAA